MIGLLYNIFLDFMQTLYQVYFVPML